MARTRHVAVLVGLVLLTLACYAPHRGAAWVYEDANWLGTFSTAPEGWKIPGRALTMQTYHWTWQVAGLAPSLYRLGNLSLHLANGLLVYAIAATLIPGAAAVWSAGVFLLHPLNSEAASYVAARSDLLMTLWVLLAVWLALGRSSVWRWGLVACALVAAGLSKETGLMAVPLLVITLLLWRPQIPIGVLAAPLWIGVGIAFGVMWQPLLSWLTMSPHFGGTFFTWPEYVGLQIVAVWRLLALLVWLKGFSIDHDVVGLAPVLAPTALALTALAIALLVWGWRRAPLVAWVIAWVGLALLPRFLFQTNEFINEHQLYLATAGLSIGIGAAVAWLWAWRPTVFDAAFLADLRQQWAQSGLSRRVA